MYGQLVLDHIAQQMPSFEKSHLNPVSFKNQYTIAGAVCHSQTPCGFVDKTYKAAL